MNDEGAGKQSSRATPADQMRVVGSGRRKVALPPGRSQLDWVRNSRSLPCRTAGHFPMSEVRKHNKRSDAWIVVRGAIFDVTPYLEYHPGGIDMLMSGVGKVRQICCVNVIFEHCTK